MSCCICYIYKNFVDVNIMYTKKSPARQQGTFLNLLIVYFFSLRTAACAAAKRAIGTRYGEQDTYVNPTR